MFFVILLAAILVMSSRPRTMPLCVVVAFALWLLLPLRLPMTLWFFMSELLILTWTMCLLFDLANPELPCMVIALMSLIVVLS